MNGILRTNDINSIYSSQDWQYQAWQEVIARITDVSYPCHFANVAEVQQALYATFLDSPIAPQDLDNLSQALTQFTSLVANREAQLRHVFLAVFKPTMEPQEISWYQDAFWHVLQCLHSSDRQPWPCHVATDPNDGDFEFSFNGASLFTFANVPAYVNRLSRNLGASFVITFVPATSFFGVKLLTRGGIVARQIIRAKVEQYDKIGHYPDFGAESGEIPLSWKAYFIPDENTPMVGECPFHVRPDAVKAVEPESN